ncbi:MAG TPA: hypothetical protein P5572_16180 [Phycisphaerae bacterium]|nr:hypothetical protein [Phycisphaerae bacterium]
MYLLLSGLMPLTGALLAQLDLSGFVFGNTFLSAIATFLSTIVLQILNVLLYGGSATL